MVAAVVTVEQGRITQAALAVGSCSATAQRLPALEAALTGRTAQEVRAAGAALITPAHLAPLAPIADVRGSAEYRMEAAATLCARTLEMALTQGDRTNG